MSEGLPHDDLHDPIVLLPVVQFVVDIAPPPPGSMLVAPQPLLVALHIAPVVSGLQALFPSPLQVLVPSLVVPSLLALSLLVLSLLVLSPLALAVFSSIKV